MPAIGNVAGNVPETATEVGPEVVSEIVRQNVPKTVGKNVMGVDPVQLGRAGLNALALAGTAIVAHYSTLTCTADGVVDPEARMPAEVGEVLTRALGAFADRGAKEHTVDPIQREANALAAMVEHARLHSARLRGPALENRSS